MRTRGGASTRATGAEATTASVEITAGAAAVGACRLAPSAASAPSDFSRPETVPQPLSTTAVAIASSNAEVRRLKPWSEQGNVESSSEALAPSRRATGTI